MEDRAKKLLIMVTAALTAVTITSAILALLLGMTIQDGFMALVLIAGGIVYFCYQQRKQAEDFEKLQANQIDQIVNRMVYQALSMGAWGTQLQTITSIQQMGYDSHYDLRTKCLHVKIQMATKSRAPLSQAQKDILRQAIAADLGQVLGQPGLMVKGFTVYPICTASTYEIADMEVQL